jgi:hypothetical protein
MLTNVLGIIEEAIVAVCRDHLCLIRQMLKGYVSQHLGRDVPDKLFSAVLGRCLRTGRLECLPSLTVNGKTRRIYVCRELLKEFQAKVNVAAELLRTHTAVSINKIQKECFPDRGRGTSFMAQQLAEYLAYTGQAVFADKDLFVQPKVLTNAKRAAQR